VWRGDLGVRLSTGSGEISAILSFCTHLSASAPYHGEGKRSRRLEAGVRKLSFQGKEQ
jgi:hypothetical protein